MRLIFLECKHIRALAKLCTNHHKVKPAYYIMRSANKGNSDISECMHARVSDGYADTDNDTVDLTYIKQGAGGVVITK